MKFKPRRRRQARAALAEEPTLLVQQRPGHRAEVLRIPTPDALRPVHHPTLLGSVTLPKAMDLQTWIEQAVHEAANAGALDEGTGYLMDSSIDARLAGYRALISTERSEREHVTRELLAVDHENVTGSGALLRQLRARLVELEGTIAVHRRMLLSGDTDGAYPVTPGTRPAAVPPMPMPTRAAEPAAAAYHTHPLFEPADIEEN